jgi:hypothetical protein
MKQIGHFVTGNFSSVDDYTSDWFTVKLHPCTFYRRIEEINITLDNVTGLYTKLDTGNNVVVRFSEKEDLTEFHRIHHAYI